MNEQHFKNIYSNRVNEYHALVAREDYLENLKQFLFEKIPKYSQVLELGAGTGRLTQIIAPHVAHVRAYDESFQMIQWAKSANLYPHVSYEVASHQNVFLNPPSADVSMAGWAFGHLIEWPDPHHWQNQVKITLKNFLSTVRPGGIAIVIETLGTGKVSPEPPTENLAKYYQIMEQDFDFTRSWIRTDYKFDSMSEGSRLIRDFFGDEMAALFMSSGSTIFPECTGIWCKNL